MALMMLLEVVRRGRKGYCCCIKMKGATAYRSVEFVSVEFADQLQRGGFQQTLLLWGDGVLLRCSFAFCFLPEVKQTEKKRTSGDKRGIKYCHITNPD